tara:strand:+ start:4086 stop:4457 length:372 start_codon:yes stop_codon:yes gene_type:complete
MRQPTPIEERWSWWLAALAGEEVEFHEAEPQCGYFKRRKFRWALWPKQSAPWIPARCWMEPGETDIETGELLSPETYCMEIDGKRVNPWTNWTRIARHPITEEEYRYLTAMSPLTARKIPAKA